MEEEEEKGEKNQKQRQCHYRTIWKTLGGSKGHMVCSWQVGLQKSSPRCETDFSSKLCNQVAHLQNVLKICMQNTLHRFQERKCRTSNTLSMITDLVESPRMRACTVKDHSPGHTRAGTPQLAPCTELTTALFSSVSSCIPQPAPILSMLSPRIDRELNSTAIQLAYIVKLCIWHLKIWNWTWTYHRASGQGDGARVVNKKEKKKSYSIIKYLLKTEITERLSNDQTGVLRQRIVCMQSLMSTDREEVWRNTSTSHMLSEHQMEIQRSWKKGRRPEQRILMFLNALQYGQGVKTENPCVRRWENAGRDPAQGARGKSPAWQSKGSLLLCKKEKRTRQPESKESG